MWHTFIHTYQMCLHRISLIHKSSHTWLCWNIPGTKIVAQSWGCDLFVSQGSWEVPWLRAFTGRQCAAIETLAVVYSLYTARQREHAHARVRERAREHTRAREGERKRERKRERARSSFRRMVTCWWQVHRYLSRDAGSCRLYSYLCRRVSEKDRKKSSWLWKIEHCHVNASGDQVHCV